MTAHTTGHPTPQDHFVDYYRVLAEAAEDHIFVIDREDRIEYVNLSAARQHGTTPEQLVGRYRAEIFPPDVAERQRRNLRSVFDSGNPLYVEARTIYDGREVWLGTSLVPIRGSDGGVRAVLGVSRDMTARKQAEDTLRKLEVDLSRAQKLEALGRLAGGIAHDFNNNLTAILGYVDMMIDSVDGDSPMGRDLEEVRRSAEHAAGLVRRLLAFGRRQVFQPRTLDLNALVSGLEPMLHRLLGQLIRLEVDAAADLLPVTGDPREIEEVFMNLALNARDAMPNGGTLTIQTCNTMPAPEHQSTMGEGRYVSMRVRDTGAGMTPYVKQHVFEPFFTTKPVSEGAGLGLSAVYGIVKQLNGFIWVESEVGQGSTFFVHLPAAMEQPVRNPVPAEQREEQLSAGSRQTILLVEDEDTVRRFTKRALEHYGYRVLEAATPEEALSRVNGGEPPSLLLTDVVMPRISGPELADRLKQIHPNLPVLYMSGYPSSVMPQGSMETSMHLISKPFTTAYLISMVQKMLGG